MFQAKAMKRLRVSIRFTPQSGSLCDSANDAFALRLAAAVHQNLDRLLPHCIIHR